jgi:hypothetical protein
MKRLLILVCALVFFIPTALVLTQESSQPSLDITGVNASDLPTTIITANVLDTTGKPLPNLTVQDFQLSGAFAQVGRVVSVESTTDESVSFGVVLVVDTSSSMAGSPIEKAKEAARLFVNSIGANDPVAIIGFNQDPYLVIDFTTDKNALNTAIDNLSFGGQTALYDATVLGIQKASESPVPRRAVIILSDGAEFGNSSGNLRESGLDEAIKQGVSVYTIGLGFGTDRDYLKAIADGTNAQYIESPSPEQLAGIYGGLAQLFRSQYIITIEADVPLDGTEYDLTLQANTPLGATNTDTATVRAPIPVPIVSLPTIASPVVSVTNIAPVILADDPITSITATVNGTEVALENGVLVLDPATFAPGNLDLAFAVTDDNGDSANVSGSVEIGALPSAITIAFEPNTTIIAENTLVTVTGEGQTALASVNYRLGDSTTDVADAPSNFAFSIDPLALPVGEQTLNVIATNAGGASTEQSVRILISPVPAVVELSGFDAPLGDQPVTINPTVTTQNGATITSTTATLGDVALTDLVLDPFAFAPGTLPLSVSVTDSNGQVGSASTDVTISPIAPRLTFSGVADGDEVSAPIEIGVDSATQGNANVDSTVFTVGDMPVETLPFTLDPLNYPPSELPISATVTDANGQATTQTITVTIAKIATEASVGEGFGGTFSTPFEIPLSVQGQSPVQSVTVEVNGQTFEFEPNADGTFPAIMIDPADIGANGDYVAIVTVTTQDGETTTLEVPFTIEGLATDQPTSEATETDSATSEATDTNNAGATTVAMVDTNATSTTQAQLDANATSTTQAQLDANATIAIQITGTAQANATATMQNMNSADATASAIANATNTANAEATNVAQANANATNTANAEATNIAQANANATSTRDARNATATQNANIFNNSVMNATNVALLNGTATQQAVDMLNANATSTREVRDATATQSAIILESANATATINTQMTATQQANQTATSLANVATTGAMIVQATGTSRAEASQTANAVASSTAQQNALIADQTATGEANATIATVEATAEATEVVTTVAPSATPSPVVEATFTPIGGIQTTGEEAPPTQPDFAPYLLCGGAILLLILLLFLLSRGRGNQK